MSEEQYRKIGDVIHTLSYIRNGKAWDLSASLDACMSVLNEVLNVGRREVKGDDTE